MLTPNQITELKHQLSQQIQHLAPDEREEAQQQIDEMSVDALELMLKQQQSKNSDKNVLRMILEGSLPSKKIDENKSAIAVLDIKPVSKGHTIIIPKDAVTSKTALPTQVFTLAKKIAKRMKKKWKLSGVEIQTETKFGEQIVNVIPFQEKPLSITSPRMQPSEEELKQVQVLLAAKPRTKRIKKQPVQQISENRIRLKRRIP